MGIRGLASYIQLKSEKCLIDYKLQKCQIVIDGNNLLHFLYLNCPKQNPSVGGDYNIFYEYARETIRLFKQCQITPIVVFDGGLDLGNRKQKTRLLRAKQKLIASIKVKPSNQHRMSVLPLLLKTVFLTVLKELDVSVIQCHYEADSDIASLARGLKCPVASNDSDFFVMDVHVIPLALMELNSAVKWDGGFALQCKLFENEKFMKFIGHKDSSIFPLMGTLLGNDYADNRLFERIFAQIHIPKSKGLNDQHRRIQGLLEWLKGQSVEGAIERILAFIPKINHIEVEVAIRKSLKVYEEETNGELHSVSDLREKIVSYFEEEGLPKWFGKLYASADLPPWVLDIIMCHKMPYQSQVEAVQLSNTFSCCCNLLKAITLISWNLQTDRKLVTLWRRKNELVFKKLTFSNTDFPIRLPKLIEIEIMPLQERQKIFFDLILDQNPGRLMDLPKKLHLLFAAIVNWVRHSHCHVRSYHVDGLMIGIIYLSVVEPRIGRIRSLKRLENVAAKKAKDGVSMDYISTVRKTFKFQEIPERMLSHDTNYDRDTVHILGEFQATFYFVLSLNSILDTHLPCTSPSEFYWATFIYNAASHFKGYEDRLVLAKNLLGGPDSTLFQTFQDYTSVVFELASPELMNWKSSGPNKPRKHVKKRRSRPEDNQVISSESSDDQNVAYDNDLELVGNRYSLLAIG